LIVIAVGFPGLFLEPMPWVYFYVIRSSPKGSKNKPGKPTAMTINAVRGKL